MVESVVVDRSVAVALARASGERLGLADFERLRGEVSGSALRLEGLRRLMADEPALEERLAERILPSVVGHAEALARTGASLEVHAAGGPATTVVGRAAAAGWVGLMVLGALPGPPRGFPERDFALLLVSGWPAELAKLRAVLAYFDRIADGAPGGEIVIERRRLPARTAAEWVSDAAPLAPLVVDEAGFIEDAVDHLQVDFANAYLGGGVLTGGCVQEEIRFAVAPELLVGMLVSPRMEDDEAIVLRGCERFARTGGYAHSLRYDGLLDDGDAARRPADLVAIDALDHRRGDAALQLTEAAVLRELGKARCGFQRDAVARPVATGNWGCGAFGGDPAHKAVIQWLAASAEGRAVRYCTFGDQRLGDLAGFVRAARDRGLSVGGLFERLLARGALVGRGLYRLLLA